MLRPFPKNRSRELLPRFESLAFADGHNTGPSPRKLCVHSLYCDSNRAIGVHSCDMHSTWNCAKWPARVDLVSLNTSDRRFKVRGQQRAPENATHPKTQEIYHSENLRFRVCNCCFFWCSLFPSKRVPRHTRKCNTPEKADFRNGQFPAFSGVLRLGVLFGARQDWRLGPSELSALGTICRNSIVAQAL